METLKVNQGSVTLFPESEVLDEETGVCLLKGRGFSR